MSDHRHQMVSGADSPCNAGPYGDTTYTKIFVGGLAWETTRETLRRYFEQFGEIVAAVVITDKYTRRSKGYGFLMFGSCLHETFSKVTFEDPESAARACQNPSPVIDGRRTNCNIAAFGLPQPHAPKNGLNLSAAGKEGLLGPIPSQATQSDHRPLSMHSGPPPPPEIYRMNRHAVCYNWQQVPMYYIPGEPGYPRIYYSYYPFYYPFYAPFRQPCDSSTLQGFRMQYPQSMRYPYPPQQYCIMGILPFPASSSEAGSTNGSISTQCSIQTYYQN